MKKMIFYCDRCGQELKDVSSQTIIHSWTKHYNKYYDGEILCFDLCKNCYKEFNEFLKQEESKY